MAVRARDKAERRGSTAHQALDDGPSLEETLRQVGTGILNEPIPETLRQALDGKRGETEEPKSRK